MSPYSFDGNRDALCMSPKPWSLENNLMSTCFQESLQPRPQRHTSVASCFEETNQSLALALEELIESGTFDAFVQENNLFVDPQELFAGEEDYASGFERDPEMMPAFASKPSSYTSRQRRHSISTPGELKKCPFPGCNKVFERNYNLQSHMKVHVTIKPHKCTECEASFSRGHDLKRHMNTHARTQVIACPHCSRQFSRQDALHRHIRLRACQE